MVEVGGHPILWHVLRYHEVHGLADFVVASGYHGESIKKYFADYCARILIATCRPRVVSSARHTSPLPPLPLFSTRR